VSRRPDERLSDDEFAHLMSECDDSLSGAATAYHAEMRAALYELGQLRGRVARAIDESVKLQAHYATLLNQHDGGKRTVFASTEEWLARLDEVDEVAAAAAFVWHRAPPCRRCSECVGCDHHWLDNGDFEDEGDPEYQCKHCPAKCRAIEDDDGLMIPDNIPRYGEDAEEPAC